MINLSDVKISEGHKGAAKAGLVVGFTSMISAAMLNTVSWLVLGEAGAPGKAGFLLAFGVSVIAGVLSGLQSIRHSTRLSRIEDHAKAVARGDIASAFVTTADATDPLHQQLNLIAEAQLKRIEEFHRLLEDSRIREERLYEALDLMDDEIAVYDPSGMLVSVNRAFTKHCNSTGAPVGPGMLRREILKALASAPANGIPLSERDMWLDHQFQMRELALAGKKPVDNLDRDGRHMRFTVIETPAKNQIEITTDITDMVNAHHDADRSRREAEAAEQIKSVTVSRLMNTIRTPMTGVLAAAEMLNETELTQSQQGKLDIIRRSSGTLLGIVQDMLDISEKHTDTSEPEPQKLMDVNAQKPRRAVLLVRSEELLERLSGMLKVDSVQSIALETIDLVFELLSDVEGEHLHVDFIMTDDREAVRQLTEWSSTVLSVNRPKIIDLNEVMTEGFSQSEEAASAATDMPLDDIIVVEEPVLAEVALAEPVIAPIVEARALPSVPEGSEKQETTATKRRKQSLDVMIVEDNDVNQIVYDQIMSNCGHHYLIVSSGEEGVNTALREKPRLILMDISMPGLNGLEATRRIRSQMTGSRRPVIVGMTSHLLTGDREKCLASGMDDYSLKPTAPGPLRAQIANWLGVNVQETRSA